MTSPTVAGTRGAVSDPVAARWPAERVAASGGGRPVWRSVTTADAVVALVALAAVGSLAPWIRSSSLGELRAGVLFVAVSWLLLQLMLRARGVYASTRRHLVPTAFDDLGALESSVLLSVLVLLGADALLGHAARSVFPPAALLTGFTVVAVLLPVGRLFALAGVGFSSQRPARVVVLGTGTVAGDVVRRLAASRHVELVGYVDDDPVEGQQVLGGLDELATICQREAVDRVVVAFSRCHPARVGSVLGSLDGSVSIDVVPRYFELTGGAAELDDLAGIALVAMDRGRPTREVLRFKRLCDVVGSLIGLAVSSVVLLPAAIAVRLSSPGPVLFRQTRLGQDRVPFQILKLRTMRPPTPDDLRLPPGRMRTPLSVRLDEHRITAVGRFLRRTGIDELPQLVNVLRGEMSLVGPRPFIPEECSIFGGIAERRFSARPGMTGLWQVSGQHDLRLDELCRLDVHYVTAWSPAVDLQILARTPARLIRGGGSAALDDLDPAAVDPVTVRECREPVEDDAGALR